MTRACIYARRSREEQAESLKTQVDSATRFIAERGWELVRVFEESGSRAEFVKRAGPGALLAAAETKAFDVVVTRDETRLGGDMLRTGLLIQGLTDAGCRLVYYSTGEEVRADDSTGRLVIAVRNFSAELEREKVASRTRENLERKARSGLVAGGAVYGYRVVPTDGGKAWEVLEAEAEVVRDIFRRYAAGEGLRAIAKGLNARRVPPPKAGRRGTGSWSYSSIREMLRRERYRGVLVWGRQAKTYRGGTKVRVARPESDWVTLEVRELRIVPEELWEAVRGRDEPRVRLTGSTARGTAPRYLLSGIGRCGQCGGPMRADNARVSYTNTRVYACAWHRDRGPEVCGNGLRRPVATVDQAVLEELRQLVTEEVVGAALRELRRRVRADSKDLVQEARRLEGDAARLRGEIERLVEATVDAPDAARKAFVPRIAERQRQLDELEARAAAARATPSMQDLQLRRLEEDVRARFAELDAAMMGDNATEARKALEVLLGGPLRFVPLELAEGKRYRVEGQLALEPMAATECSSVGVPSGARTVLQLPWSAVA